MEPDTKMHDPDLLWPYLLGDLSEADQERIEETLFSREEFVDELSVAEDDLIDAYVAGELTVQQRERFESFFLTSPRRKERLAIARSLAGLRPQVRRLEVAGGRSVNRPIRRWPALLAAAAAVILVSAASVAGVSYLLSPERDAVASLNRQVAQLEAEVKARPAAVPETDREALVAEVRKTLEAEYQARGAPVAPLTFLLDPSETRRDTGRPEARLSISSERGVRLQLTLSAASAAGTHTEYRVTIQNSAGAQAWGGNAALTRSGAAALLAITIPAGVLRPGEYRVLVRGVTAAGDLEDLDDYWVFDVVSR